MAICTLGKMRAEMHSTFWRFFNEKSATLNCLISVGHHLELRVAVSVCWHLILFVSK